MDGARVDRQGPTKLDILHRAVVQLGTEVVVSGCWMSHGPGGGGGFAYSAPALCLTVPVVHTHPYPIAEGGGVGVGASRPREMVWGTRPV